jgi:hypothetical protein
MILDKIGANERKWLTKNEMLAAFLMDRRPECLKWGT